MNKVNFPSQNQKEKKKKDKKEKSSSQQVLSTGPVRMRVIPGSPAELALTPFLPSCICFQLVVCPPTAPPGSQVPDVTPGPANSSRSTSNACKNIYLDMNAPQVFSVITETLITSLITNLIIS